mmetsp:Transcript_123623/g.395489  ORF Transcript_123623/g.395489 Transcript_123623/m.395489 type:complete len:209 (+) Transcript_123623:35-661(+)
MAEAAVATAVAAANLPARGPRGIHRGRVSSRMPASARRRYRAARPTGRPQTITFASVRASNCEARGSGAKKLGQGSPHDRGPEHAVVKFRSAFLRQHTNAVELENQLVGLDEVIIGFEDGKSDLLLVRCGMDLPEVCRERLELFHASTSAAATSAFTFAPRSWALPPSRGRRGAGWRRRRRTWRRRRPTPDVELQPGAGGSALEARWA